MSPMNPSGTLVSPKLCSSINFLSSTTNDQTGTPPNNHPAANTALYDIHCRCGRSRYIMAFGSAFRLKSLTVCRRSFQPKCLRPSYAALRPRFAWTGRSVTPWNMSNPESLQSLRSTCADPLARSNVPRSQRLWGGVGLFLIPSGHCMVRHKRDTTVLLRHACLPGLKHNMHLRGPAPTDLIDIFLRR
jgi:hypothetical protein